MSAELVRFVLKQRWLTLLGAVFMAALGVWCYKQLKLEAYPDISDTQVVVVAQYDGQAAEEVEQQVTIPIERALNSVPRVIARRSRTIFGLSVIELTFDDPTDDYFARQLVLEKLRDADLPDGVELSLGPLTSGIGEMYRYSLKSATRSSMRLREFQDWVVVPRFLQINGVADVVTFGGEVKQFRIEVDPLSLTKYDITLSKVADAVTHNNRNGGGAVVDNKQQQMVVRGEGQIRSIQDVENIIVDTQNGTPIYVHMLAKVKVHAGFRTGVLGLDAKSGGVEGIILMRRWENPSDVLRLVHEAVDELNVQLRPENMEIFPIYDRTELVDSTLHTVSHTLLEALLIVIGVLFLFLGSAKAALLTALTIPLSLLFAFICMHFAGVPANLLSLGALDFGIVVDATVVLVEHVMMMLHKHRKEGDSPADAILQATLQVERPVFFSMSIIILAYFPLFTLERVERRLFSPMAFTVCAALVGSLLITLTIVPVLATFLFRKGAGHWENPVLKLVARFYRWLLERTLKRPGLVIIASILVVIGSFVLGQKVGLEFLPQLDEGVIWIRVNLQPGISLRKSTQIATKMRRIIQNFSEVRTVVSQSGRNDTGTDPFGPNRNEMLLALKPYDSWDTGRNKARLVEALSAELKRQIPGATFTFTQPIIDTSTEMATGSSADLAVILSGPDLTQLRELGTQVLGLIEPMAGAADYGFEQEAEQSQLLIRIARDRLGRYGINVSDVQDVIEMAIGGKEVSTLLEGDRRFGITIKYPHAARGDIDTIGEIQVPTPDGGRVPLSRLADINVVNGQSIITRTNNRRQITVKTNVRGRDQGSFVAELQAKFTKNIQLPQGVKVSWGGQFENLERARRRLSVILPITLLIIFALLFWMFGTASDALLVLANVPLALVGGIVALYARGINFSVSAAVGFVSLFGVTVMGGVLYISEVNRRRNDEKLELYPAVMEGSMSQLQPFLMLILVALLGLVPAALAEGIGSDVQRPLASVVVGGLLSILLLTLVTLPNLYYYVKSRLDGPGGSVDTGTVVAIPDEPAPSVKSPEPAPESESRSGPEPTAPA